MCLLPVTMFRHIQNVAVHHLFPSQVIKDIPFSKITEITGITDRSTIVKTWQNCLAKADNDDNITADVISSLLSPNKVSASVLPQPLVSLGYFYTQQIAVSYYLFASECRLLFHTFFCQLMSNLVPFRLAVLWHHFLLLSGLEPTQWTPKQVFPRLVISSCLVLWSYDPHLVLHNWNLDY